MLWICLVLVFVPVHSHYSNLTGRSENLGISPCTDENHFFLAPGVLTAGGTNRACVSRFYPEGPARMLLSLVPEDNKTVTASRELPPGDGGCLDFSVPLLPNTKADLVVNIWYPSAKCAWERRVTLRISSGRVVVVHTERARYRPGETIRARVFALKADLTPAPGNIEEIWIEGPPGAWEGTRVAQWSKVRSKMGLAQVQYDIDEQAPPGRWTVRAKLGDGSQGSSVFWVGHYELPPFQLTVRHAPRVLRTSERLVWTVCVRYPWTEAVEGMLVIRLRGAGSDSGGIRTAVRLRAPRACHRHAAAAKRVGLGGDHPPQVVVADFSFQEEGTRVWQNTTVVSQVVDKPVTLEFVTKHRTVISPGLPYKLKVKATRWDDKPASNERIRVCRYSTLDRAENIQTVQTNSHTDTTSTCISGDTDSGGVARVMFAADDDGSPYYRFEASLLNDSSTTTGPLTLATRRSPTQAALGPLRADFKGTRTFVPLYLSLQNVTKPITVHFVVITRGGIIYRWGATTQCPIASSATHIQTASRNGKCNNPMAQYDEHNQNQQNNNQNKNINQNEGNNNINRANNENSQENKNAFDRNKNSRSYDVNINLYINQNQHININYYNKTNGYLTRNMNQNDKNNYLHKNDPHNAVMDRFSPVHIKPNVFEKINDVNSIQYEANASDALLERYLLRVMLPIKVTQQMCPDSHLIAYFYYNGEFVSASKHFEMDDCFVNKVDASFISRQALPGSLTTLQVTTPGPALCAITALDSSAKWGNNAVKDVIIRGLKRMIDGHRNLTEYDAAGDCFLNEEEPQLPANSLELTASWLAAAGVRTVGDIPVRRSCDTPAELIDEGTVPRSDFSEAWLWRLITVVGNSSSFTSAKAPDSITRYEANAVCLSKTGVSVSPPAVLQVFREFFIHADGPKRLRRGDSTIIRYRLFNYLYEPLSVQIQFVAGPGIQGPADVVEAMCVPPRASSARRVSVAATSAGDGRVVIRAKSVNDGGCGNHTNRAGVSDEVIMKIHIEPEGVPIQEHKSMLLCGKDKSNSTSSQVSWTFSPASMIPGTEELTVWVAGDIVGPLLADADSLVLLPRGCGEQNMARLALNLISLDHLDQHSTARTIATEHVARGFARQMQYVHPSGGFSAFGASDVTSSTWLTAFSLRYLRRAHQVLMPNQPIPPAIERAERWLLDQQMENGCFRNEGQVFHRELRGGLNEDGEVASVALTAYVITSLLDSTSPLPLRAVRSSLSCLRALPPAKHSSPARLYAHALLALAFIRLKTYEDELKKRNEARYEDLRAARSPEAGHLQKTGLKEHEGMLEVMELIKMATRDGEFLWWDTGSVSTSIEATGYALLALRSSPSALREFGAGAVRWLAAHRSQTGGFLSTQDTLVGLEALSAWSSLQPAPSNLTVTARSGSGSSAARVRPGLTPEMLHMGTGDQITIGVEGSGCALVQASRSYRAGAPARGRQRLAVQASVQTHGAFDCDADACFCAAVVQACAVWSGGFPEMALLEVTLPGGYGVDAARLYDQLHKDSLLRRIELSPSGSRATLYLGPRDGTSPRRGHACFLVHAVGPRARTRPAYVRLLDYYSPDVNDTQIYTIPEECPSSVSHESSQDMTSDNLFSKAKSLSDDGEILITHEFSFEDIPEGIPLEDPLYDNLTVEEKSDLTKKNTTKTNTERNTDLNYTNNVNDPNHTTKNYYITNDHQNSDSTSNSNINYSDNSYIQRVMQNPNYVSFLPYIPNSNQQISPMRNIEFRNPDTDESNDISRKRDKIQIDDKLDLDNKAETSDSNRQIFTRAKSNEEAKTLLNSGDKQVDVFYKTLGEHDTVHTDVLIKDNIKDSTNINYNENANSVASEKNGKENFSNATDAPNSDNEINTELNHRIEIRDEHRDKATVDNPVLSDFHVIDSEKDLEVPSGVEGPVPAVALPPPGFVPPHLAPENFVTPGYVPINFDSRKPYANFAPIGVPSNYNPRYASKIYREQNPPDYFTPKTANNFARQDYPNNFIMQTFVPDNLTPLNMADHAPGTFDTSNFGTHIGNQYVPRANNFGNRNYLSNKFGRNSPVNMAPKSFVEPFYEYAPPPPTNLQKNPFIPNVNGMPIMNPSPRY